MIQANCTTCNATLKQGWEVWYGTKADGNPYPYCESCWKSLNNPLGINKQQEKEIRIKRMKIMEV